LDEEEADHEFFGRSKTQCIPTSLDYSSCVTMTASNVDAYTHDSNNIHSMKMNIQCDDEYVLSSFTMQDSGDVSYTCCDVGPYGTYTPGQYDESCTTVSAAIIDPINNWDYLDMCDEVNSGYMVTDQIKGLTPYMPTCLDANAEWEQLGNVVAMRGFTLFTSVCSDSTGGGAEKQLQMSVECCMVNVPSSNPVYNPAVGLPTANIYSVVYATEIVINPSIIEKAKDAFTNQNVDTKNIGFEKNLVRVFFRHVERRAYA